jgi:hypothetical protein
MFHICGFPVGTPQLPKNKKALVTLRQKIDYGKQSTLSAGNFDSHGGAPMQYKVHHLMQHVLGFTGSLWMPPSVDHLLCIAPAAARLIGKQTTIKKLTYFAGRFDGHGNAPVRYHAHSPMEEVQGSIRSHCWTPLGKYLM